MKKYFFPFIFMAMITLGWVETLFGLEKIAGLNDLQTLTAYAGRFANVYSLYQSCGLPDYFTQRALLWTENSQRRNELLNKLPPVATAQLPFLAGSIQQLLAENPADPACLVMAGDLHCYQRQKETAGWYYQQAWRLAPNSSVAVLALADFYLYEYRPEEVRQILKDFQGPNYSLRLGEACFQMGEYPLALGYLRQAYPLPSKWEEVRIKALVKTYLALGELAELRQLPLNQGSLSLVTRTLLQEYKGWAAYRTGNDKEAKLLWEEGRTLQPDYKFWQSNLFWLPSMQSESQNPPDLRDKDINSSLKIIQAQALVEKEQLAAAYKAYLSAIKVDNRSLIAYLGAGSIQLQAQNYEVALDLCQRGLAVNPRFGPLILKKIAALQKLSRIDELTNERASYVQSLTGTPEMTSLKIELLRTGPNQSMLLVKGQTKNLAGFWVGTGNGFWEWHPWWGGPVALRKYYIRAWVLPTGSGLAGEVYYLQQQQNNLNLNVTNTLSPEEITLQFPMPVKLVAMMEEGRKITSRIYDEFATGHRISRSLFPTQGKLQIRYQMMNGFWGSQTIDLPAAATLNSTIEKSSQYAISTDPLTNRRLIRLNFAGVAGIESNAVQVSFGEIGRNSEWLPLQPSMDYLLSEGDGVKNITVQIRNSGGIFQTTELSVELDTKPPQIEAVRTMDESIDMMVKWVVNEPSHCKLRIFSTQGEWCETPVIEDNQGGYSVSISLTNSVFTQIMIEDKAGNILFCDVEQVNSRIQQMLSAQFQVNDGQNIVNSLLVAIKPVAESSSISWAVSNDLQVWSPWLTGDKVMRWRLVPGDGQKPVYIKYRFPDQPRIFYQLIPVLLQK